MSTKIGPLLLNFENLIIHVHIFLCYPILKHLETIGMLLYVHALMLLPHICFYIKTDKIIIKINLSYNVDT